MLSLQPEGIGRYVAIKAALKISQIAWLWAAMIAAPAPKTPRQQLAPAR